MESMERNWLIRTSQNQVLGPVAKQKLLEFIEKGALGTNDEVTSGNGYWFSLREKELVDKYIYGDIPQGYNPISESKSVLARKENPEKTTSINTAPANRGQLNKPEPKEAAVLPNSADLEFPDMGSVSSTKPAAPATLASQVENTDVTKLPSADDLEFPDITLVSTSKPQHVTNSQGEQTVVMSSPVVAPVKKERPQEIQASAPDVQAVYPKNEDLDFPDIDSIKEAIKEEEKDKTGDFEFKIDTSVTQTIAVKKEHIEAAVNQPPKKTAKEVEAELSDFGENTLTLIQSSKPEPEKKVEKKEAPLQLNRKEDRRAAPREQHTVRDEDRKLLHDRRAKTQPKTPVRENREVVNIDSAPGPLRKRNDNYIFFILIILVLILLAVFFYFKEILNKPLPV